MEAILNYGMRPEDDLYNILGCDELSSAEQICSEFKIKALQCHPDKHPDDPQAAQKFALLQRAKEILCDARKRKDYDAWRLSGIAMSFGEWTAKKDSIHTSLHWAMKSKKEPMLESGRGFECTNESDWTCPSYWRRESAKEILNKFRNYEI